MAAGRFTLLAAAMSVAVVVAVSASASASAQPLPAVVVWDFDNQTPAGVSALSSQKLDYLRRSLSENLTIALLGVPGLQVVERQHLKDVLAEQKLSAGDLADEDTRLHLGHIAGAGRMVFGGFLALGDVMQVNVRVVDSTSSRVLFSDEATAESDQVMSQVDAVNLRLIRFLGGGTALPRDYPADRWQAYDAALALSDTGRYEDAIAALQGLLAAHPDFAPAERQMLALLDKMKRR